MAGQSFQSGQTLGQFFEPLYMSVMFTMLAKELEVGANFFFTTENYIG
jgi:hypothetical protein